MTVVQVLLVNVLTDGLPALALTPRSRHPGTRCSRPPDRGHQLFPPRASGPRSAPSALLVGWHGARRLPGRSADGDARRRRWRSRPSRSPSSRSSSPCARRSRRRLAGAPRTPTWSARRPVGGGRRRVRLRVRAQRSLRHGAARRSGTRRRRPTRTRPLCGCGGRQSGPTAGRLDSRSWDLRHRRAYAWTRAGSSSDHPRGRDAGARSLLPRRHVDGNNRRGRDGAGLAGDDRHRLRRPRAHPGRVLDRRHL